MRRYLVLATVVALALPAAATAKGPASASITGPSVRTLAERKRRGAREPARTLANAGGFFAQMFGQTPDPTFRLRPKGAPTAVHRGVRRARPEQHREPRHPVRVSVREAGRADVHEARSGLLG